MEQREELSDHKDLMKDCIITGLKEMYFSEILCDVTIQTSDKCFRCHRVVLASVSPYFSALFTCPMKEAELGEVCLSDVPSSVLQTVLHYIYTGEVHLTLDNMEDLFILSSRLQITAMQDLCSRYLAKRIDNGNCLWIYRLAHSHNHGILLEETLSHIGQNMSSLSAKEDFFHLEMEELVNILSSDDLTVSSELAVYDLARSWWEFRTRKDNPLPPELLKVLRLPLLTPDELGKVSENIPSDDSPLQSPTGIRLRQGMFEERILCIDPMALEETDPSEEDYYLNAYDPRTCSWEKLPFCGYIEQSGIVSVGCKVYVSGGFKKEYRASNALHMYDSVLNEWKELPSMTHPRACHGFLAYRNTLYAFGGHNDLEPTDSVECFNVLDNSWRNLSSMPAALHSFASAVLKGRLFAIGGMTETFLDHLHHQGFHIYDVPTDTWSQFSLPVTFSAARAVTMDDKICIVASYKIRLADCDSDAYTPYGTSPPYTEFDSDLRHDEQTKTICKSFIMDHLGRICHGTIPPALESSSGSAVVRWKHRIYIVGGAGYHGRSRNKMFYWSPGEPGWTLCKENLPFLLDDFGSINLLVPLKHLSPLIPGRRSNYNFISDGELRMGWGRIIRGRDLIRDACSQGLC
ncbi:kelch repeat and BTB domain-containing protein 8-like [Aquarana catesbeiana]|uniref:kelch repeat and BTB domain-containing protein 8-like n=1 Tax=Aquarana catesbeiana TaxID=8400 RepID=UPI003CC94441